MPKRIVDGERIAASVKLRQVEPESFRLHYPYLLTLAMANGVFEYDTEAIWARRYSLFMPHISKDLVAKIMSEFERRGLLGSWQVNGHRYGYWIGMRKQGLLPPPSRIERSHQVSGPEPPQELLNQWDKMVDSQWIANGQPMVSLGSGSGSGSGSGKSKSQPEKAPAVTLARKMFELYNSNRGASLSEATEFTIERDRKCRSRLGAHRKEPERFLNRFGDAVKKASATPWLCGENDRGWKPNFDWFIANDTNYIKVLEGKYEGVNGSKTHRVPQPEKPLTREQAWENWKLRLKSLGERHIRSEFSEYPQWLQERVTEYLKQPA
jgi:hypothetical protein